VARWLMHRSDRLPLLQRMPGGFALLACIFALRMKGLRNSLCEAFPRALRKIVTAAAYAVVALP
jgi:hypothetical protein